LQRKRNFGGEDGSGVRKDLAVREEREKQIPHGAKGAPFGMTLWEMA
jgi:hypothetical protein